MSPHDTARSEGTADSIKHKMTMEKLTVHDLLLSALGKVVHQHRHSFGLSQEELAARSGIHRTYISDIEHGVRNVSLRNVSRLAAALGLPASTLIKLAEGEMVPEVGT